MSERHHTSDIARILMLFVVLVSLLRKMVILPALELVQE